MATFGRPTFSAVSYAASRPTYPRALFDHIFRFHAAGPGRWGTAVDLGCGTGQATVALSGFERVVGVDPSNGMVDRARLELLQSTAESADKITYVQSEAEKLAFLQDGSVDLMISAQSGHWFDWSRMWPEASRVLAKNGTFAIWTYAELRFPRYPTLTPLVSQFFQGTDPKTSVGPHFQRPGRTILEDHLVAVPDARTVVPGAFSAFERIYFTGAYYPGLPSPHPVLMHKRMTWQDVYGYIRTCSALHTFLERNPDDVGPEGDLAMRFWKGLMRGATEAEVEAASGERQVSEVGEDDEVEVGEDDEVEVEWPLSLILVRRA